MIRLCEYCGDTGFVNILRFYTSTKNPYEVSEICCCDIGKSIVSTFHHFYPNLIGKYYTRILKHPLTYVDNRIYAFDPYKRKTIRMDRPIITDSEIKKRLKDKFVMDGLFDHKKIFHFHQESEDNNG